MILQLLRSLNNNPRRAAPHPVVVLFALALAAGVVLAVVLAYRDATARSECLAFGYPDTRIAGRRYYCLRRVNQSDEVVPLEQLRRRSAP